MEKHKNIPKLRFPEYKGEWERKKLREVAERVITKNISNNVKNVFTNSAVQGIVNQRDFFDKDIANQNNLLNYYVVEKNDFIYNPRISNFAPVGPISRNRIGQGVMSPLYSVFKFKVGELDFLETYFSTTLWYEYLESIANYGARFDRMNITIKDFYEMPLPFPTLPEQKRIASFFTVLDKKIAELKQKKNLLEQYKKGVMQKLFSQELRFKNENGKEFPKWDKKKLGEITSYVDYRGRAPIKTEEGYFLVTAKNIKKGFIDYECSKEYVSESNYTNVMSKGLPQIGDILFTTEAPMGNVARVDKLNIALAQRVIKFRGKEMLSNLFLLHYMLSDIFQNLISKKSIGTTVQGISGKELHKINVCVPCLSEQTQIANFLSQIDEKINRTENQIRLTEQYKKSLLQKMFI